MYRTISANPLQATGGCHIVVSQESLDDSRDRRLVVIQSTDLRVVRQWPGDADGKRALEEFLVSLSAEHDRSHGDHHETAEPSGGTDTEGGSDA